MTRLCFLSSSSEKLTWCYACKLLVFLYWLIYWFACFLKLLRLCLCWKELGNCTHQWTMNDEKFSHRSSSIGEYSFLVLFLTCLPHQQLLAFSLCVVLVCLFFVCMCLLAQVTSEDRLQLKQVFRNKMTLYVSTETKCSCPYSHRIWI